MWKAKYEKRNWCLCFTNARQVSVSGQWAPYNVGLRRRIPLTLLIQLWLSSPSYIGPVRVVQYYGQLPNLRSDYCSSQYLCRRSTSTHNIVVVILLMLFMQVFINRLLVSFKIRMRSAMNSLVAVFLFMHSNISLGPSIYFLLPRWMTEKISVLTMPILRGLLTISPLGLSTAVVLRLIHVWKLVHGLFLRNLWCVPSCLCIFNAQISMLS